MAELFESDFLVPNGSFVVVALLALIVVGLLLGVPALALSSRRRATPPR